MKANTSSRQSGRSGRPANDRKALIELRRDVLSALAALERQPFTETLEEEKREEEIAAGDAILEVEHRYHQGLIERLRAIEEAFQRLDAGSYGLCTGCGSEISRKRLEANPAVGLCLVCQELAEMKEAAVPVAAI
ncbi:MAG TPA: TraR/DksA C4-type zinc finger protein [Blastocatellia bacterium]|nr:TraR/DksA C4-type zinc finger protein [Blastocatellia bacterium]